MLLHRTLLAKSLWPHGFRNLGIFFLSKEEFMYMKQQQGEHIQDVSESGTVISWEVD